MRSPEDIDRALAKAADQRSELTDAEREAIRELLEWWRGWKALGKLGKAAMWLIITVGAAAGVIKTWVEGTRTWFGS